MALLQEIKVPLLAVNDTSLTVMEIGFANKDKVKKGDNILVFETSKTTYEVEAETDGYIQYLCETGADYEVNEIVARIFSEEKDIADTKQTASRGLNGEAFIKKANKESEHQIAWQGETLFSAEAIRLIESSGIGMDRFRGKDLVNKRDVEEALGVHKQKSAPASTPAPSQFSSPDWNDKITTERLPSSKKREIAYLSEVQSAGLTSTINTAVETAGIFAHINQSLKYFKDSLLPVIIYETARLLKKYPMLNAFFSEGSLIFYKQVNIGFAIDMGKGLKVAKITDADQKNIHEIEEEMLGLSNRYIDDNLSIDDLTNIGFTITDLSAEGVLFFRPLINMMNSAILGISAIDQKLQRCILSVTFDHRVTEGKPVAQFLGELKKRIESYSGAVLPVHEIICHKCYRSLKEDLGNTGFMKCITPEGKEGYICQSCLSGF